MTQKPHMTLAGGFHNGSPVESTPVEKVLTQSESIICMTEDVM